LLGFDKAQIYQKDHFLYSQVVVVAGGGGGAEG